MPTYDYACAGCGGFDAIRSIARRDEPAHCPKCGAASPRVLVAAPQPAQRMGAPATRSEPSVARGGGHRIGQYLAIAQMHMPIVGQLQGNGIHCFGRASGQSPCYRKCARGDRPVRAG